VNAGSGYQANETIRLVPNNVSMGGTEAIIRIDSIDGSGSVTGFTTVYGGYDFEVSSNPSADFYEARGGSGNDNFRLMINSIQSIAGIAASATTTVSAGGTVTSLTITDPGSGYQSVPIVTISNEDSIKSGVRAIARAEISEGNVVTAVRIVNPGIGYTENPTVTVADPPAISGIGTYQFNELITGESSRTTARVKEWIPASNTLKISYVDGTFTNGELIVGAASSATYAADFYTNDDTYDKYTDNDSIETEADLIVDFTESNPFGNY